MTPLRLKTVRPFIWEEISLQQAQDKDGVDLKNKTLITAYVKDQIRKLIQRADHEWDEMHPDEPRDQRDLPLERAAMGQGRGQGLARLRRGQRLSRNCCNAPSLRSFDNYPVDDAAGFGMTTTGGW